MIRYIKTEQLIRDARKLAWMLPDRIRGVAGVPRSGMIAASVIATARSVPLYCASRNHEPTKLENGFRILGRTEPYEGPLVVVEDSVNSGQNLETFGHHATICGNVVKAAVYVNPSCQFRPDVWAVDCPMPHYFEWHFFGSDLTRMAAFDMDGVICEACPIDCDDDGDRYIHWMQNVRPLNLPYPHVVPLIVTARLEKWRKITEAWLTRHGVRWKQLHMGKWGTLLERQQRYNAGEYKGEAYKKAGQLTLFFEDSPQQSREIFARAGKPVVCVTTGEVIQ